MKPEYRESESIDALAGSPAQNPLKPHKNDVLEPLPSVMPSLPLVRLPVRSAVRSGQSEVQPRTISTAVVVPPELSEPDAARPSAPDVLKAAGAAARAFLTKTVEAFLKFGVTRLIDLIAPGVGAAITALEHVVSAVQAVRVAGDGSGDLSFPVGTFGGFEFMAEVHVGDDPDGPDQRFGAFITPYEGDSLFDQLDITPDSNNRYAAAVGVDLSKLSELPDANSRLDAIRSYAEGEVLPHLGRYHHGEEVELVYMHDQRAGIGAWIRVSGRRTSWAVYIWKSAATHGVPA